MKYSKQEILEEINRVSQEYCGGDTPKWREFEEYGFCDPETVGKYFGSWSDATEKAGYEKKTRGRESIPKQKIIEDVERVSQEYCNGKIPTMKAIREFSEFSYQTVKSKISPIKELPEHCEFKTNIKYGKLTSGEVIEKVNSSFEEKPHINEVAALDGINYGHIYNVFDSYKELIEQSDFEYGFSYYDSVYRKNRKRVLERDEYSCVVCNKDNEKHKEENGRSLDVHHIKPQKEFGDTLEDVDPEEMHDTDNLVTLCWSCHQTFGDRGDMSQTPLWTHLEASEWTEKAREEYSGEVKRSIFDY